MPWIAVDCGLPDHPKMIDLPNDTARWGWIVVLMKAKTQRQAGRFASPRHFSQVVRPYGRFLAAYIKAGLIDEDGDELVIHDWRKHQWAASKARLREDDDGTNGGSDEDIPWTDSGHKVEASRAVPVPVLSSTSKPPERARRSATERLALVVACPECQADVGASCVGVRPERNGQPWERYAVHRPRYDAFNAGLVAAESADALDSWYRLTGSWPSAKVLPWLNQLIDDHGDAAVSDALGAEFSADSSRATILGRVRDRLEREAHEAEKRRSERQRKAAEEERQRIESMPAEQREANMKRLRDMMAESGVLK